MMYNDICSATEGVTSLMQQMFVISDCLLKLGYRKLAMLAQQADHWEFANDFVTLVSREARNRQDDDILDRLAFAGLIYG